MCTFLIQSAPLLVSRRRSVDPHAWHGILLPVRRCQQTFNPVTSWFMIVLVLTIGLGSRALVNAARPLQSFGDLFMVTFECNA